MIEEQEVIRRRRRRTPAEIQQIVSEFMSSDLTQVQFCRRQGLTLSTLGRYLRRLRPSSDAGTAGLVPVELAVKKCDTVAAGRRGAAAWRQALRAFCAPRSINPARRGEGIGASRRIAS